MSRLYIFALDQDVYPLVKKAIIREINSSIDFYKQKAKKENPKPYDIRIMERTLKEISLMQDFLKELEIRERLSR